MNELDGRVQESDKKRRNLVSIRQVSCFSLESCAYSYIVLQLKWIQIFVCILSVLYKLWFMSLLCRQIFLSHTLVHYIWWLNLVKAIMIWYFIFVVRGWRTCWFRLIYYFLVWIDTSKICLRDVTDLLATNQTVSTLDQEADQLRH